RSAAARCPPGEHRRAPRCEWQRPAGRRNPVGAAESGLICGAMSPPVKRRAPGTDRASRRSMRRALGLSPLLLLLAAQPAPAQPEESAGEREEGTATAPEAEPAAATGTAAGAAAAPATGSATESAAAPAAGSETGTATAAERRSFGEALSEAAGGPVELGTPGPDYSDPVPPPTDASVGRTAARPREGFAFGSYGRIIIGTDLEGSSPRPVSVVAHGSRVVEPTYLEL